MCGLSKIKYIEYPICKTCIHFLPEKGHIDEYGRCNLFGEKNIINGKITYKYADLCRMNDDNCNITGRYYEPVK